MKTKLIFALLLAVLAFSCSIRENVSFEEVSAPYVEMYGQPEEISDFYANEGIHYTAFRYPSIKYEIFFEEINSGSWRVYFERSYANCSPGHP